MRILLGMSGGLDSTCAAKILIEEGHTVEGAVLVMHAFTERDAAKNAAATLGIPLHEVDGTERFRQVVQKNFAEEYLCGRTPNPCVVCNREVKFALLYEYAMQNGFDAIATGHYASIVEKNGRYAVALAKDTAKDQSYVLWSLPQHILSHLLFPLSGKEKSMLRAKAREESLTVADRAESQEICFIPDGDYAKFICEYTGTVPKEGDFVDESGAVLGRHKGIIHYTVGQRKGLGIAMGKRMFVTAVSAKTNTVTLSENPNATVSDFYLEGMVFSGISEPEVGAVLEAQARVRYLSPLRSATVTYLGGGCARVHLHEPARAVTPGQSAVFYSDGAVQYGGVISLEGKR